MAKNNRRGLGRGLSSLLGESVGEVGGPSAPAPHKEPAPTKLQPTKVVKEPRKESTAQSVPNITEHTQVRSSRAAQQPDSSSRTSRPTQQKRVNPERAVADAEVVPPKQRSVSSSAESTEETNRPYIEEDDHVVIKSVTDRPKKEISEVAIDLVEPNPDQPRTHFKPEEIEELAASIKKEGLLQPILVRKVGSKYQIIAGERRWQACKSLGSTMIPVRFWKADDDKVLELALIENVQRSDLNPIEEAYGYKRLMERKKMTQSELAIAVSKGRSTIANALRLLDLPEDAQQMLFEEKITAGHARAILSVPTQEGRNKLTKKLSEEKLSVRETEALARLFAGKSKATDSLKKRQPLPDVFKKAAKELRQSLQTNVRIKTVKGKNKIEIEFKDEEELQRLFESMTNSQAE